MIRLMLKIQQWLLPLIAVSVTISGCGNPTKNSVVNDSAYDIEVRYVTEPSSSQQEIFDAAETRWESIITGDLPDITIDLAADYCGVNEPAISETIDDIIIWVDVPAIDGAGGVLGSAGPCTIRGSNNLTVTGLMRFDSAAIDNMEANGTLDEVILHEMGHVIGIGTLWDDFSFLDFSGNSIVCSYVTAFDTNPTFTGPLGVTEYNNLGGVGDVPLEEDGGAGTKCSHIDEDIFDAEVMTGYIENAGTTMPISLLTIKMLEDLGYSVADSEADAYNLPDLQARTIQGTNLNADNHLTENEWEEVLLPKAIVAPNGTLQEINTP